MNKCIGCGKTLQYEDINKIGYAVKGSDICKRCFDLTHYNKNIENEAKKHPFISIEDFQSRCKVSTTLIDKMRMMGIFKGMPESSQLSLF